MKQIPSKRKDIKEDWHDGFIEGYKEGKIDTEKEILKIIKEADFTADTEKERELIKLKLIKQIKGEK